MGTRLSFLHWVLLYFENTGSASSLAFVQRTGAANPFAGFDEDNSTPALADLDSDGDIDLVTGPAVTLKFENAIVQPGPSLLPEPRKDLLVSAGAALLAWLARGRRRRG